MGLGNVDNTSDAGKPVSAAQQTALDSKPTLVTATVATAIGAAAKTTSTPEPAAGSLVAITYTNGNNAASPTVSFNGGADRNIRMANANASSTASGTTANGVILYWFDGVYLHQLGTQINAGVAVSPSASSLAQRDSRGNLFADSFVPSVTSTATNAGTTMLTADSTQI